MRTPLTTALIAAAVLATLPAQAAEFGDAYLGAAQIGMYAATCDTPIPDKARHFVDLVVASDEERVRAQAREVEEHIRITGAPTFCALVRRAYAKLF